jgi:hypothetical protein
MEKQTTNPALCSLRLGIIILAKNISPLAQSLEQDYIFLFSLNQ